jgi:hypothetical protein
MKHKSADNFFDDIDFVSIVNNVKGIMTSDGTMSTLLDYERVLDEADLYAYQNWESGELVQGPDTGRYSISCVFMWPYKLMPDPSSAKRLAAIGCNVSFKKGKIRVPIEVKNYDDFVQGTRYPKGIEKKVWFICIEIPKELMNEIKEGSIDLADQTIDLEELSDSYEDDLDQEDIQDDPASDAGQSGDMGMNAQTPQGTTPPLA